MTAINMVRTGSAVYLATDGAAVQYPSGVMAGYISKQQVAPHLHCAFAVRGEMHLAARFLSDIGRAGFGYDAFKNFCRDGLRDWYKSILRKAQPWYKPASWLPAAAQFDLFVAGWSETTGADSFTCSNIDRSNLGGPAPWDIFDPGTVVMVPGTADMLQTVDESKFEPVADSIRMMNMQRRHFRFFLFGKKHYACGVGGFIELSTVTQEGISSSIIHRWPDNKGERMGGPDWEKTAMLRA